MNCCCAWGAAVAGEWPEFDRICCPIHRGRYKMCKRHAKEDASADSWKPPPLTPWPDSWSREGQCD